MKWEDKKRINIHDDEDMYQLLNSPASNFYAGAFYFVNYADFTNKIKADLLYFIEEFERVIRASFNSSLYLYDIDIKLFEKMYPNFSNNIFKIKDSVDVKRAGEMLGIFRRINAHSIPSIDDIEFLRRIDAIGCGLQSQQVLNPNIKYIAYNGELSFAGLIFIILNLGREKSIESLTKKNQVIGLISCGSFKVDDGNQFVKDISKVDLTIPIREDNKESVASSVIGNMIHKFSCGLDNRYTYELLKGGEIYQNKIDAIITNANVFIKCGSLTNIYYENSFDLKITDKDHFVELSNQFPPFIFVDLLYKLGIQKFDNDAYKFITETKNWDRFSKLRYPKFYVDKNIDILLADEKHSDIRFNSNVCNGSMVAIFLRLEKSIIKFNHINIGEFGYSRVHRLLEEIGCPKYLCEQTRLIRNLVSHCAIIGEYCVSINQTYQFTFENIISYLMDLLDFFKIYDQLDVYDALKKDISGLFIGQIISIRAKLFSQETVKLLQSYPNIQNIQELKAKRRFYDNTSYNIEIFNTLNRIVLGEPRIIALSIKEFDFDLILNINEKNVDLLNNFIKRNHLIVSDDVTNGVIRRISFK